MPEHCASGQCQRPAKCVNCSGDQPANSKECPQWEKEKKSLKIKCEQNISFPEARKQYEQFYQARTYASAVKPGTCNKSTETDNKSTQMDDSFTEYLKQQQEKQQEPRKEKPKEKGNPSRPGQTLKPTTLEMIRKDEEKKKREEKDKLKKQQTIKDGNNITQKSTERKRRSRKSNTSSEESIFCV